MKENLILSKIETKIAAIILFCLSTLVMWGWIIHSTLLVQIYPTLVPMQFNTALGFSLISLTIFSQNFNFSRLSLGFAIFLTIFSSLILCQYIFDINLKIDQLFITPFTSTYTSHPGRMAPNTALAFVLSGIALTLATHRSSESSYKIVLLPLLTFIVATFGIVALFGYITDFKIAYGWGRFTHMAPHTALCFSIWGISFFIAGIRNPRLHTSWLTVTPGILILMVTLILWQYFNYIEQKQVINSTKLESQKLTNIIKTEIDAQLHAIHRMATRSEYNSHLTQKEWEHDANNYLRDAPYYVAFIFYNPHASAQWFVSSNAAEKDFPLIKQVIEESKKFLSNAKESSLIFPFNKELLLSFIFPVQQDSTQERALIIAVLNLEKLFNFIFQKADSDENYTITILEENMKVIETGTETQASPTKEYALQRESLEIADKKWTLEVYPNINFLSNNASSSTEIILIFGILFSITVSLALLLAQKFKTAQFWANRNADELKISENFFRLMLNSVRDYSIIRINTEGIIQSWGEGAARLSGYQESEIIGKSFSLLYSEEDQKNRLPLEALNQTRKLGSYHYTHWTVRKDRSTFLTDTLITPLYSQNNKLEGFSIIGRDITEEHKMEKMKNEFISTVSHELRTPLTSIQGALGILDGEIKATLPEPIKPLVKIALNNSQRLIALINDILDLQKIESGKMDFHPQVTNLSELIQHNIEVNRPYAMQFKVEMQFENLTQSSPLIVVDPNRIAQVLTNLISNAVKFSEAGQAIYIRLKEKGHKLRVEIEDKGPGIPYEFQERLFKKFAQANSSDSRQKGGTGLGLSICKLIIEKSGGVLGYNTEIGKGTTFYFEFSKMQSY